MADAITLSQSDAEKLRKLLADFYGKSGSTPQRPRLETGEEYLTPEVYVALTPSGGIPALSEGSDTGTAFGTGDVPGSADCNVYQIIAGPLLEPVTGLFRTVYNLGDTAVTGNRWILTTRDKFGRWFVTAPATAATCPPPPPAPTTGSWYCVNGVCAYYADTPPQRPTGGPYNSKTECLAACP